MKKLILTLILAVAMTGAIYAEQIASIDQTNTWVYLYNAKGSKYKTLSTSSVGWVVGYSSTIFVSVSESGTWVYIYDADGRRLKTMSRSTVGDVIGVAGNTFTSRNGSWIYTWDKDGRKISTRSAH